MMLQELQQKHHSSFELRLLTQLGLNPDLSIDTTQQSRKKTLSSSVNNGSNKRFKYHSEPYYYHRLTTWNDLPEEIQLRICKHLNLLDLYAAHLSGLFIPYDDEYLSHNKSNSKQQQDSYFLSPSSSPLSSKTSTSQTLFRKRIKSLQPLRDEWLSSIKLKRGNKLIELTLLTPLEFARLHKLTARNCSYPSLLSLHQLTNLKRLDISRTVDNSTTLKDLPPCSNTIIDLRTSRCHFVKLPKTILSLYKLIRLDLSHCHQLTSLPRDMGKHLRRLCFLNLIECPLVHYIPLSLLRVIERNVALKVKRKKRKVKFKYNDTIKAEDTLIKIETASQHLFPDIKQESQLIDDLENSKHDDDSDVIIISLFLTERFFEQSYLKSTFTEKRFPVIVKGLVQNGTASFFPS